MNSDLLDWLALIFRFVHVLAAIMWIGESIFFMWLDHSLQKPTDEKEQKKSQGILWMIHGGGVFHVNKRILKPVEIPKSLHWFKWQSYTTWLSGFALILVAFYLKGGEILLKSNDSNISPLLAIHIGIGFFVVSWIIYDLIWRSPLRNHEYFASFICFGLLVFAIWWICGIFNGRAAYLHVGAMLGSLMAGNVVMHIIPNQRKMLNALKAGKEHNLELSRRAKQRSTHNNYMTFPVLFMMLSMHFSQTHGSHWNWVILVVFTVGLAGIRYFMNIRYRFSHWLMACVVIFIACAVALWFLTKPQKVVAASNTADDQLTAKIERGKELYKTKACFTCHDKGSTEVGPLLEGIYGKPVLFSDNTWQVVDEAYLRESIKEPMKKIVHGYQPLMAPIPVTDEEVGDIIAYLKSLTTPKESEEGKAEH